MEKTYSATIDYTPIDVRYPYRRLRYIGQGYNASENLNAYFNTSSSSDHFEIDFEKTHSGGGVMLGSSDRGAGLNPQEYTYQIRGYGTVTAITANHDYSYRIEFDYPAQTRYRMRWWGNHIYEWNWDTKVWDTLDDSAPYLQPHNGNWAVFGTRYVRTSSTSPAITEVRLYALRFYDSNSNPTSVLIPCQRKSDNKVGVYDTVRNVFIANANTREGASDFYAGPIEDELWDMTDPGYPE